MIRVIRLRLTASLRRLFGITFGASLASASVEAAAACLPPAGAWRGVLAVLGAAIAAVFSSVVGAYGLSWRAAGLATACGAATALGRGISVGCWVSAAIAAFVVCHEREDAVRRATPAALMEALHVVQFALVVLSAAVSLASPRPRPFVVGFTLSAFALWRLLEGSCPLTRAEDELRALRGETPFRGEAGFIGHHVHRATGVVVPERVVPLLAYAAAALAFAWYAAQAFR
jgi:hypothetical protein